MRAIVRMLAATALLAGCVASAEPVQPQPCRQVFNAVRCLAMTDYAAFQLQVQREDIAAIDVLPEPTPEIKDGVTILQMRSGGPPIDVRVTMTDGSTQLTSMNCVGIASHPACLDDPHLSTGSVMDGGYYDRPCCPSPVPSPASDAMAEATALEIDRLDIPIDHVGRYEVRVGEADLPDGILTTVDFALVDDWPPGVSILEGVRLEIRTLGGEPIRNIYEHGWREGTERVVAILVFDVFRYDPGAVLAIRDVVVR